MTNLKTFNLDNKSYQPVEWSGLSEYKTIVIPKIDTIPNWFASRLKTLKHNNLCLSNMVHNSYDMIVKFGMGYGCSNSSKNEVETLFGIYQYPTEKNRLDIPIDCYYFKKRIKDPINHLNQAGIIYSRPRNSVLVIGGSLGTKTLYQLSINNLKWKLLANIEKYVPVQSPAVCLVNKESDLVMIGGDEGKKWGTGSYSDKVQMYSIQQQVLRFLQNTNVKRYNATCVVIEDLNKIIVGGGWTPCTKYDRVIEIYDMHKNEWFLHPAVMNYSAHGYCGRRCLLHDANNCNIVYCIDRYKVGDTYKTMIESVDLRDNYNGCGSKKWNLLSDKSLEQMFANIKPSVFFPVLSS